MTTEVLVQGNTEADDATLGCASILDEEEKGQNQEGDCGAHDRRVARRLTSEGEVCAVCSKRFPSRTWNSYVAHAEYESIIMKDNVNVKVVYLQESG